MQETLYIKHKLHYEVDDVLNMKWDSGAFDVIIEKGLLDSILCKKDVDQDVSKMMSQIYKVLNQNGVFICVSHGDPKKREMYFDKTQWEVSVEIPSIQVGVESDNLSKDKKSKPQEKSSEFYCYILKKK